VIRTFRSREAEDLYSRLWVSKYLQAIAKQALRKLQQLDAATNLRDLALPGNRLKKLSGNREGQYSIRINDQWRICFNWVSHDAFDVEITDYH